MKIAEIKTNVLAFLKANLILLIGVALIGFVFGHGCGSGGEDKGEKIDPKKYEQLVKELAAAHDSIKLRDSIGSIERAARQEQNEAAAKERVKLQAEARKASENASYWQGVAKQGDEAKDTETSIAARDSTISSLYVVIATKNRELEQVDSIIYRKDLDIALLDAANTAKSDLIDRQHVAISNLNSDFQKLIVENKSLRKAAKKKKFWGGVLGGLKTGAAATGGFILGRAIK